MISGGALAANATAPTFLRPGIAVDTNGKLHVAFNGSTTGVNGKEHIFYVSSKQGGGWRTRQNVTSLGGDYNNTTPAIATSGGYAHLIWTRQNVELTSRYEVFYSRASILSPALIVTKQAEPDLVQAGAQLAYTIHVTNTGDVDLHATVIDTLPAHVMPKGTLIWTPLIPAPGGIWTEQFTVTVEMDYTGPLTNVVKVTTEEGATGLYTETSTSSESVFYLPIIMRNYP